MFSTRCIFFVLIISFSLYHFLNATNRKRYTNQKQYINCSNLTQVKRNYDIFIPYDMSTNGEPEPLEDISLKLNTNVEKIRSSLCQIKNDFEKDIHFAEVEADTFNNDRLEQLDGTVTSRKVGSALRHTILKVGECVSNTAKQVLMLPIRIKSDIACVAKELLTVKNFSTDIANIITETLNSIVHYPRHMAVCFKTEGKINCLAKVHKKVIKNTISDIMGVAYKSVDINRVLMSMVSRPSQCSDYAATVAKFAMVPLKLSQCIINKIY